MAVKIKLRKVTVVAERVLRDAILELLKESGATGWTISAVEGEGTRGIRASEWEGPNVMVVTLVSVEKADEIMEAIAERYFEDWSVIVYASDVEVLRGEKYLG